MQRCQINSKLSKNVSTGALQSLIKTFKKIQKDINEKLKKTRITSFSLKSVRLRKQNKSIFTKRNPRYNTLIYKSSNQDPVIEHLIYVLKEKYCLKGNEWYTLFLNYYHSHLFSQQTYFLNKCIKSSIIMELLHYFFESM